MSKQEQLRRNEVEYGQAKSVAEANRLDAEWNAIWTAMTADERRAFAVWRLAGPL